MSCSAALVASIACHRQPSDSTRAIPTVLPARASLSPLPVRSCLRQGTHAMAGVTSPRSCLRSHSHLLTKSCCKFLVCQDTLASVEDVAQLLHDGVLQASIGDAVLPKMRLCFPRFTAWSRLYLAPLLLVLLQVSLHCLPVLGSHLQSPHGVQVLHNTNRILHEPLVVHVHWLRAGVTYRLGFVHCCLASCECLCKSVQDMSSNPLLVCWCCSNCLVLCLPHSTKGRDNILGVAVSPNHTCAREC
mmetsp:Transcript_15849/g.28918  ORF Transcript_15849/g.28918 Transcript_15849/m.28918 type:complete len:245 (-) Transcript_15849:1099-1833(-)